MSEGRTDSPRRLALLLVKPFEDESECALPEIVNAVESALIAAEARGAERERVRCTRLCVDEYARWKDADNDGYGIAVGAIGAASNILCAIERIPCVSDDPVHENEGLAAESLRPAADAGEG